jgi:hypothetical protein
LRPDITVRVQSASGEVSYTVFEIKLTEDAGYAASGYAEAIVYRHEYAEYLRGWPKAVLVTSRPVEGRPRTEDDVVATSFYELSTSPIIDGVLTLVS